MAIALEACMMASREELFERSVVVTPDLLPEEPCPRIEIAVHDASRLGWQAVVPLPDAQRRTYTFELEIEVPTNLVGIKDPWAALQSYARLDGAEDTNAAREQSLEAFRRSVVVVSSKLARARDGFMRHCTLLRSCGTDENHWQPLALWLRAASTELANARSGPLQAAPRAEERSLADEFLSLQLWTVLTDCGRAIQDVRRALEERDCVDFSSFESVEAALASALEDEIAYRHKARFALAEPVNVAQLERLLARMQWLKRRFERVLFLDIESYEVQRRLSGWFSALVAMVAYLWFFVWQLTLERHPVAIGSGVVAFALITAVAYASRERLKEVGRNWLEGRIQRIFAQRVSRFRLPKEKQLSNDRQRGALLVAARESFSQSTAQRSDPRHPDVTVTHNVTVLRFVHRGFFAKTAAARDLPAKQVRFIYRFDFSALFPRLHDAVRGFASLDKRTGRVSIVDVPRNYALPLRTSLRWNGETCVDGTHTLMLNKNGLVRIEAERP